MHIEKERNAWEEKQSGEALGGKTIKRISEGDL